MSITDELREWGNRWENVVADEIDAIADRIDAEHAEALSSKVIKAISYGEDGTEFVSMPVSKLEECYVELPKDADGEIIHVGDMMEHGKARGHVIALMLSEYPKKLGGELHWGVQLEGEQAPTALDAFFHHYHEPTVEAVLREFARECLTYATCVDDHEVQDAIEMYAAKLRLAGE